MPFVADPIIPHEELDFDIDLRMFNDGKPFTGTAFDILQDGLRSERGYVNGWLEGRATDVDSDGVLRGETNYSMGHRDGAERRFRADGTLKSEVIYDQGSRVIERTFDDSEKLIDENIIRH